MGMLLLHDVEALREKYQDQQTTDENSEKIKMH